MMNLLQHLKLNKLNIFFIINMKDQHIYYNLINKLNSIPRKDNDCIIFDIDGTIIFEDDNIKRINLKKHTIIDIYNFLLYCQTCNKTL